MAKICGLSHAVALSVTSYRFRPPDADGQSVGTVGLSLVSGLGGLLGFYIPEYVAQGYGYADITALMTYPALFM